ncbi:hypothetical protein [Pseudomonas sp. PSKL.D1]|uniref:hypothetical protein n=1 Tax=Pseudomonas sp. PSKL.D1 TaxID=3029060 RepID=UPI0023813BBD|nr:hypothetical protein [Pseudomonas sp. PSKL.D1]WDY55757.1 hypothetical protein PVV54_14160 [Pseudomonas sp. PSKL.D1]
MSNIHDQAMHYIHQQVLERLLGHMTLAQRASLQLLIQRFLVMAGGPNGIGSFRLLVVHSGDRRSARMLAILRAAQLSIALRAPATFHLRVLVTSLPAISGALLEHHERCFNALFMHDDPRVQMDMIEGGRTRRFCSRPSGAGRQWPLAREALLLFGHLVDSRPEALLGSRMHLELADALHGALEEQSVGGLVTALPARQRRHFLAWARRSMRLAGEPNTANVHQCMATLFGRLGRLHATAVLPVEQADLTVATPCEHAPVQLIAIDDLFPHMLSEGGLDHMLGCRFEPAQETLPLAVFLDPLAAAQLHEMRVQCIAPAARKETLRLACQKGTKNRPVAQPLRFAKAYGIEQTQLVCMLYSPFADQGRGLERFLQCRHADMLVALPYLHRALQGKACPDAVRDWLVNTSGLGISHLRAIYDGRVQRGARRLLANLARRDVHLELLRRQPGPRVPSCEAAS